MKASPVRLLLVVALVSGVLAAAPAGVARRASGERDESSSSAPASRAFQRDGARLVRLAGGAFDPLGEAAPLELPAVAEPRSGGPFYWLAQIGDDVAAAVRAVRRAGGLVAGYVPDRTFVVRATPDQRAALDASGAFRWTGLYQPGMKVAPSVGGAPGLLDLGGERTYRVFLFAQEPRPAAARAALAAIDGVELVRGGSQDVVLVRATRAQLPAIAAVPAVEWVGVLPRAVPLNMNARWVVDTGVRDVFSAIRPGRLDGSGQTAGVADTAINYVTDPNDKAQAYFRDCASGSHGCALADYTQAASGNSPSEMEDVQDNDTNHRKMSAYFDLGGSGTRPPDAGSHGTHVAGSVTGDLRANGTWDAADGMAPAARLVHQNISDTGGGLATPADTYDLLSQSYRPRNPAGVPETWTPADYSKYRPNEDARTHNNSYGLIVPIIDAGDAARFDQFVWDHEDMMPVISAGNDGPAPGTVGSPSVAKNTFSSGASANGRQPMASIDSMAVFSSHGPTADGRYGVTVATPGQIVVSARGGGADEQHTLQGTSMSAPVLTGVATLVREYFYDGWGPAGGKGHASGAAAAANRHNPSAALVKATVVNGAERMRGWYTGTEGTQRAMDGQWPSAGQGFGRVNLANSLFFEGDDLSNWYYDVWRADDEAFDFPSEGAQERSYTVDVAAGKPFDVTLAWTDAPNLLPAGSPTIVNNLDLVVTGPGGTTYAGNNFNTEANPEADVATTNPGPAPPDTNNVEERVRIADPAPGTYTITVRAPETFAGPQGFALAASGALTGTGAPARGAGLLPDEPGAPEISDVRVERVTHDTAWVRWRTDEPTTGQVVASGGGDTLTFVDHYNTGPDGYPCYGSGPTETSEEYANRPVLGTRHEARLTCLEPNTTYALTVSASDRAGAIDSAPAPGIDTGAAMFGARADDIGQLVRGAPSWRLATQLYTGRFAPGDDTLGAFMFRLPASVDPARVMGAAVRLQSYHDITNTYTDDSRLVVDLLDEAVEPEWGTQTYEEIRAAPMLARLNPEMADREGGLTPYTYSFDCRELSDLRATLGDDGQRKAAFRALNLSAADESLFSYEFGFNRRTRGPQNRPQLVLYMSDAKGRILDPDQCDPTLPAPAISKVRVAPGLDDTSTTVSWRTDVESDSTVLFREQGTDTWTQVGSPVRTTHHMVTVRDLDPNADYEFAVRSETCNGKATTDANGGAGYSLFLFEGEAGQRHEIANYGFESGDEGWTTERSSSNPAAVPWTRSSPGHESEFAWRLEPYTDEEDERLISPAVTHPGGTFSVRFWLARDLEDDFDYLHVEWSSDGSDWTRAASFTSINDSYPQFDREEVRFSAPAGDVRVRFRFVSDALISSPLFNGVAVDDVSLANVTGDSPGDERLSEGAPAPSAGATNLDPPATRRRPTEADLDSGTATCAPFALGRQKRPGVRLAVSDRTPERGERVIFKVRLHACRRNENHAAALAGTDVVLQRRIDAEWRRQGRKTLDAQCKARFSQAADYDRGRFRAVWPKQLQDYRRGRSRIRTIEPHA